MTMASDQKKLNLAIRKYAYLHSAGVLSVLPEEGEMAIFVTSDKDKDSDIDTKEYEAEAREVAREAGFTHNSVRIIEQPKPKHILSSVRSRNVASICFIGHGSFGTYATDYYKKERHVNVDWYDLSLETNHLKTGIFDQRTCALLSRDMNVALGSFVMYYSSNILMQPFKEYDVVEGTSPFYDRNILEFPNIAVRKNLIASSN
jgi:hypothetical protein